MQAQQKLTFKVIWTVCKWNKLGAWKAEYSFFSNCLVFLFVKCIMIMSKQVFTVKQLCLKWKVCTLNK